MTGAVRSWCRTLASLFAVVVGLVGCTSEESPPTAESPTAKTTTSDDGPRDRDERAVLAALRQLDPCALLDAALTATPALPEAQPLTGEPFSCSASVLGEHTVTQTFTVDVSDSEWERRKSLPMRELGGAKAYLSADRGYCEVYLPVSFDFAIAVGELPNLLPDDNCGQVQALAASVAVVLADPDGVSREPVWDACSLLSIALSPDVKPSELRRDDGVPLDQCAYGDKTPLTSIILGTAATIGRQPDSTETIADQEVSVSRLQKDCGVYWQHSPFPSRYARFPYYEVLAGSPDCQRSKDIAESTITVLKQPPPTDVPPQRPLLYRPDEPDGPDR